MDRFKPADNGSGVDADVQWPDQVWIDPGSGEQITLPPSRDSYELGDPSFQISKFWDLIDYTVKHNRVIVLASGTGNGKSIMTPQILYASGRYRRIYQTQPQIVATRENAEFTKELIKRRTGHAGDEILAYRTATEGDRVQDHHVIREHTDGYLLALDLGAEGDGGHEITADDVVIIDEAHMRNPNIDVFIARMLQSDCRLVIQSASMNIKGWADYVESVTGEKPPVLDLPGVMYPVATEHYNGKLSEAIIEKSWTKVDDDRRPNIMVLIPGRHDAQEIHSGIARRIPSGYTILHLNKDQTIVRQQRCFSEYPDGKIIIATDVGRQSITVPDLHYVFDGGYQKTGDWQRGVQYLRVVPVAEDGLVQARGRVGRTMPGTYVDGQLDGYPLIPRNEDGAPIVDTYSTPPIQRTDPAPYILKLAGAGLNLADLPLQNEIRSDNYEYANRMLARLGAKALDSYQATEIGQQMLRLRLNPNYARMVVEARQFGPEVELQMAAMAYACQQESITMSEQYSEQWRRLTNERRSDMLVQLDVMAQALWMNSKDLARYNIVEQRFTKARTMLEQFCDDYGFDIMQLRPPTEEQRQQLIGCIVAGADMLFVQRGHWYSNDDGFEGRPAKSTSVKGTSKLLIGSALVLEHYRNKQLRRHDVITNATAVTPELLRQFAPHRCEFEDEGLRINANGQVMGVSAMYFDGKLVAESVYHEVEASHETTIKLLKSLLNLESTVDMDNDKIAGLRGELQRIKHLLTDKSGNDEYYGEIIKSVESRVDEWSDVKVKHMHELAEVLHRRQVYGLLQGTLAADTPEAQAIAARSPDTIRITGDAGQEVELDVDYDKNYVIINCPTWHIKNLHDVERRFGGRKVYVWTDSTKRNYMTLAKAIARSKTGVNRASRRSVVSDAGKVYGRDAGRDLDGRPNSARRQVRRGSRGGRRR